MLTRVALNTMGHPFSWERTMFFETNQMQNTLIRAENFLDLEGSLLIQDAFAKGIEVPDAANVITRHRKFAFDHEPEGTVRKPNSKRINPRNLILSNAGNGLMMVASMGGCYPYVLYRTQYQRQLLTAFKYIKVVRYDNTFESIKHLLQEVWFSTFMISVKDIILLEFLNSLTHSTEIILTKKEFEKLSIDKRLVVALYKLETESMCSILSTGFDLKKELKNYENHDPAS